MEENTQKTLNDLNALLGFLRSLGYNVETITLTQTINLLQRFDAAIKEELNV